MHTQQSKPNPKSLFHSPPQSNTTVVAKSGKTNINNSVLSERSRKYSVDETREMTIHAEGQQQLPEIHNTLIHRSSCI